MEFLSYLPYFMLVLVRISTFIITAPVLSNNSVPKEFKIGISFFMALIMVNTLQVDPNGMQVDGTYMLLIIKEALVGLLLGFVANIIFESIKIAGAFIDLQLGFIIANAFDPHTNAQSPLSGKFKYALAVLFLLSLNGHHLLIKGLFKSYEWVSVEQLAPGILNGDVAELLTQTLVASFSIAFMIAAPLVGALFLVDVALGIIGRTVPQMNIFVVGFPIKITAHFLLYILVLPSFFYMLQKVFTEMINSMGAILKVLGG